MGLNAECDWDKSSNDRATEAMYEALRQTGESKPLQYDPAEVAFRRPEWDSRSKMREVGEEAIRICTGDRNADYGPPEDNHANTALLWNAYLVMINQRALSGYDVCQMMAMVKMARNEHKRKKDNTVDQLGYILNSYGCL